MCFMAPEKLQTTLKFLELLSLFPRARLIANMNINFKILFVIQMSLRTFKGLPTSIGELFVHRRSITGRLQPCVRG